MAVRKAREIEAGLAKKGFIKEAGGRHPLLRFWVGGKKTGFSTAVDPKYEYGRDLLSWMKSELRLDSNRELLDLIDCPMSEQAYLAKLRGKGLKL